MKPPAESGDHRSIHVLVVDDSAVVRQFMSALLSAERGMEVTVAADPLIALRKMKSQRPDVIVLDLEMPRMDGLTFLRRVMREDPIPVVVCSSHAAQGTENALRALDEGAVEVVAKPKLGVRDFLRDSAVILLDTIRAAAQSRPRRRQRLAPPPPRLTASAVIPRRLLTTRRASSERIVAIGASTGGTDALGEILLPGSAAAGLSHFIDHQLGASPVDQLLMIKYLGVPAPFAPFYQGGIAALNGISQAQKGEVFADLSAAEQLELVGAFAQGNPDGWQGPPGPFFYFVLRNDAVDVVYGTKDGIESLGIPYMAHIEPPSRWSE